MSSAPKRRTPKRRTGNAPRSGSSPVGSRSGVERLQYKVIELSTVDEGTIESTINEWVALGWQFDGVQFAMRDASKRPAMAFVLFTREGRTNPRLQTRSVVPLPGSGESAWERLRRLAEDDEQQEPPERSSE